MMSSSLVSAGSAASGYYRTEGYYIAGSPEAEQSAIYHGKGAEGAGLHGRVDDERFTALLDGQTPDDRTLGRYVGGERQHRPGLDLTFSAPKGVSIAALVGGDTRIIEAHTKAVKATLDYVEANLIQTRRTVNGVETRETGGEIIAGIFQHDTSRKLDPQLHSHAVITNVVKDSLGTFRSMSNERLFEKGRVDGRVATTIFLGQMYRNELASRLEGLGYELKPLDKGLFDIKGIPEKLVEQFSKRAQEIEAALKDRGMEKTTANSQLAALATRASKKPVERAELRSAWDAEVKALGINLEKTMAEAQSGRDAPRQMSKPEMVAYAVDYALKHHAERNSIYAQADIANTAMAQAPTVTANEIEVEVLRLVDDKVLFTMERKEGRYLTDVENVRLEKENIRMMDERQGRVVLDLSTAMYRAIGRTSDSVISQKLRHTTLTPGQKEGVAMTLSARSGVVGVQGFAGTGKTYALATASRMAEARGYTLDGIAPSHKAVTALGEAVANSSTVESLLVRFENGANLGDKSRSILVVDEASMLSSEGMNRVLRMAHAAGYARTVLVGDILQLEAVGAGSAFRALQEAGMPTAVMEDIQRQRTQEGRDAVLSVIKGDIAKAMNGIAEITETGGKDKAEKRANIAAKLAETYTNMPREDRAETGVIVLTNEMRRTVNETIQSNLKLSGEIGGGEMKVDTLRPMNFTQAQAGEVGSYKQGDILVFPIGVPKAGLKQNVLYTVTEVDRVDQSLRLSDPEGRTRELDLHWKSRAAQKVAVFQKDTQTFVEGDQVKFKITDRELGIVNSAEGTFTRAGRDTVNVRTNDGETLSIPTDSLAAKGMQLAYAATAHDFQGSTVERVLLGMSSEEQLTDQKSFYVGLSRMKEVTYLITDDAGRLAEKIRSETGERINALEALQDEKARLTEAEKAREEAARQDPLVQLKAHAAHVAASVKDDVLKDLFDSRDTLSKRGQEQGKKSPDLDRSKDDRSDSEATPENARDDAREKSLSERFKEDLMKDQKTRDERSR